MAHPIIRYLKRYAEQQPLPKHGHYRMAAAVLNSSGRILSVGFNSYVKTHPKQAHYANRAGCQEKKWLHAEIAALVKVRYGVPFKIVVIRLNRKGDLCLAKPCSICMLAIHQAGIKLIEYST